MTLARRVLCATDLSPASRRAWDEARRLAALCGAEVTLLHVVPPAPLPPGAYLPPGLAQQLVDEGLRDARARLDEWLAEAPDPAPRVGVRLEQGGAAARILEVAAEEKADVVVMGTHGRTGPGRVLLGSVADRVVRLAPCPVLTVSARTSPAPAGRLARICYATDFSPGARAAWPWALGLAQAAGAEVDLVHVTPLAAAERQLAAETLGRMADLLHVEAEAQTRRFLEGCPLPKERVHVLVGRGDVADEIHHWARSRAADLIVMGTRGWSTLIRWMLGSVAHHVIPTAPCPVLTVGPRSPSEEHRDGG